MNFMDMIMGAFIITGIVYTLIFLAILIAIVTKGGNAE